MEETRTFARPLAFAEFWHRLSLDAPTVAFVWCVFLSRCARIELPWYSPVLLSLATWIVYVADRILDGLHKAASGSLRERHHFYIRYRTAFIAVLAAAALVCVVVVLMVMRRDVLLANCILGSLLFLYFVLIHGIGASVERWFPKELIVGMLFASAVGLPTWVRLSSSSANFLVAISLLAALFWLNCVGIETWESRPVRPAPFRPSGSPHFSTLWAGAHFSKLAAAIAVAAGLFGFFTSTSLFGYVGFACATGSVCLGTLHHFRRHLSPLWLRISADASLLTPLVMLPLLIQATR